MNIIDAIITLIRHPVTHLVYHDDHNSNRANQAGYALEQYIKDLFADSLDCPTKNERIQRHSQAFSYCGNNNNPPDIMLRNGDAVEVKKIQSPNADLALNSSHPKAKLFADSSMIATDCKNAENWTQKDLIYAVGVVNDRSKLKHLCMVYGEDYCADEACYARIKSTIKQGVESISGVEFASTNELGRINRIDPLGITYLRVRGMWGIANPWKVFDYVYQRDFNKSFNFMCIINEQKWQTLTNRQDLLDIQDNNLTIRDVQIQNPNNPAELKNAKLIVYSR
ncbi:NgoPII family restriction endonuclease [Conchiformibius kuhniae]|uniref:NgoPII family restriction endonuclease n=1 Tax=Conchiformibius kuhniae TaxID=211502 RepID=A0A8T9MVM1_9NEIS|nr:NgoPII family restriction endonuclease [Conchiformibius kuhniae]UOP05221.1 NgoPII family restriction endonuclease [Conchiformibius kuhniae]